VQVGLGGVMVGWWGARRAQQHCSPAAQQHCSTAWLRALSTLTTACTGQSLSSLPCLPSPPFLPFPCGPVCRSQYLVSLLGACITSQEFVIVTELMPGGTLFRALKTGKVTWYRRWGL